MTLTSRTALFAAWCLAVAAAHWSILWKWYDFSNGDETASHLILIPVVTAGLIVMDRRPIFASTRTAWKEGLIVIAAGAAFWLAALLSSSTVTATTYLGLAMSALILLCVGGFVLLYGPRASRAALFPLAFLVFAVPIPQALVDATVEVLKNGSTELVAWMFALTGTPYFREGYVFALPSVVIEVADACSGIRSSIALVLTSLLAGHMYLETPWKKAVLVLLVLPFSILKNGIRIVTLTLLAVHVDPSFLTGQLHHDGGIVFFVLTLVLMAPVLAMLRRSERPRVPPSTAAPEPA